MGKGEGEGEGEEIGRRDREEVEYDKRERRK